VVVVDDERVVLRLVRTVLELDGHEVYEALNGPIGLGLIAAVAPEVVVLDVMMPGMDGVEVCGHLRRDHPDVGVLILTGSADPGLEARCLAAGAAAFMTKPVLPEALSAAVADLAAAGRAY
jgi:CheY-like chemotaxis protein